MDFNVNHEPSEFCKVLNINDSDDVLVTANVFSGITMTSETTTGNVPRLFSFSNCNTSEFSKNIINKAVLNMNDNSAAPYFVSVISSSDEFVVRNNLIYDIQLLNTGTGSGNPTFPVVYVDTSPDVSVYHNTIDNIRSTSTGVDVMGIRHNYDTSLDIFNNIVTNLTSTDGCYGIDNFGATPLTIDYNCVWTILGSGSAARFRNDTEGTHGINADPKFIDPSMGVYRLGGMSPCFGTGRSGQDMGCYGGPDPLP
jgi:hypothetical protein